MSTARRVWAASGPRPSAASHGRATRSRSLCASTSHAGARPHGRTSPQDERDGPRCAGFTALQRQRGRTTMLTQPRACSAAHTAHVLLGSASATRRFRPRVDVRRLARGVSCTSSVTPDILTERATVGVRSEPRCGKRCGGDAASAPRQTRRDARRATTLIAGNAALANAGLCVRGQPWLGTCLAASRRRRPCDGTIPVWMRCWIRSWTPPWPTPWTTPWTTPWSTPCFVWTICGRHGVAAFAACAATRLRRQMP